MCLSYHQAPYIPGLAVEQADAILPGAWENVVQVAAGSMGQTDLHILGILVSPWALHKAVENFVGHGIVAVVHLEVARNLAAEIVQTQVSEN